MSDERDDGERFESHAARPRRGLAAELLDLLRHNKKWWMLPIIAVFLALGVLVMLAGSGAAPFIYTLF